MDIIKNYIQDESKYLLKSTITDNSYFCVQKVQKMETQNEYIKKIFKIDGTKSRFNHTQEIEFLIRMQNTSMPFAILESLSLPSASNHNYYIMTKYMKNRDLKTVYNTVNKSSHDLLTSWDNSVNNQPDLDDSKLTSLEDIQVAKIIYGTAFGLNQMHKNGLVHGNLRPSNILFSDQSEPLITDFIYTKDIITDIEFQKNCTKEQLTYMAPELLSDEKHLDFKSDVYSFSVIVLQLLASGLTFSKRCNPFVVNVSTLRNFIESDAIYDIPPCITESFRTILSKNLSRNPNDRGSMDSFLNYFNDSNFKLLFDDCNDNDLQNFKQYVAKLNNAL